MFSEGNITWSEKGKENLQARRVYSIFKPETGGGTKTYT